MRRFNLFALALIALLNCFIACSDDDPENVIPPSPQEQNKYITGTDLSRSYNLEKALPTFSDETFHALGYGYDITGKYAHPDWIRKKVVDPQKFEDDHYHDVMHHWSVFVHGGSGTITGAKDDVKKEILDMLNLDTRNISVEYKNAFKGIFDTPFENDTVFVDHEYYYAIDRFASTWYEHYFNLFGNEDFLTLLDYLTDDFKSDLVSKSAKEIIALYGTHVMVDVEVGWRQDYYYRNTSNDDLQKRMVYASSQFLGSTPGIWMSPGPNTSNDKENLYSEYVSGVDGVNEPVAWMFDLTNYEQGLHFESREHAIQNESLVLIGWGKRSNFSSTGFGPIIPIYEFVSDVSKREALQKAYKEYLEQ